MTILAAVRCSGGFSGPPGEDNRRPVSIRRTRRGQSLSGVNDLRTTSQPDSSIHLTLPTPQAYHAVRRCRVPSLQTWSDDTLTASYSPAGTFTRSTPWLVYFVFRDESPRAMSDSQVSPADHGSFFSQVEGVEAVRTVLPQLTPSCPLARDRHHIRAADLPVLRYFAEDHRRRVPSVRRRCRPRCFAVQRAVARRAARQSYSASSPDRHREAQDPGLRDLGGSGGGKEQGRGDQDDERATHGDPPWGPDCTISRTSRSPAGPARRALTTH